MGNARKIFEGLLVLQYRSGNKKAFSLLVNRYNSKMCSHAYWLTYDKDIAKDIVQDSWRTILKKLPSLKNPNNFGSWAMRIVTRKSIDYLNKNNRDREKLREYYNRPMSDSAFENKEADLVKVYTAIKKLPQDQQVVLRLFYLEEYSLREISEILEKSEGTIKSRLYHAREKLKTILKNRNDG
ncbi:RNA polymerase sigma factor [uncultured Eudoraea sp.]|uniref:RNA polymerase sigma factor n=1 Tax=uncultured Eudoraea sp. TaxID=1035614 RepID=UPI002638BD0D|nr:RNA polymerase sigma factor [uncultured Eudoraea sp.]